MFRTSMVDTLGRHNPGAFLMRARCAGNRRARALAQGDDAFRTRNTIIASVVALALGIFGWGK